MEKLYPLLTCIFSGVTALATFIIVLQNQGVIDSRVGRVSSINIPKQMEVTGSVSIDNTVDINIKKINGYSYFYDSDQEPGKYHRLPVYSGY